MRYILFILSLFIVMHNTAQSDENSVDCQSFEPDWDEFNYSIRREKEYYKCFIKPVTEAYVPWITWDVFSEKFLEPYILDGESLNPYDFWYIGNSRDCGEDIICMEFPYRWRVYFNQTDKKLVASREYFFILLYHLKEKRIVGSLMFPEYIMDNLEMLPAFVRNYYHINKQLDYTDFTLDFSYIAPRYVIRHCAAQGYDMENRFYVKNQLIYRYDYQSLSLRNPELKESLRQDITLMEQHQIPENICDKIQAP